MIAEDRECDRCYGTRKESDGETACYRCFGTGRKLTSLGIELLHFIGEHFVLTPKGRD